MKKTFQIAFLIYFFCLTPGISVAMHYCGGAIDSVSFFLSQKKECKCGTDTNNGCCQTESKVYKTSDAINAVSHKIVFTQLFFDKSAPVFNPALFTENILSYPETDITSFPHKVPIYLFNKVLII